MLFLYLLLMNLRTLLISVSLLASLSLVSVATARTKDTPVEKISRLSYLVTQEGATEKPFENAFWDHHETGIYVDIIDGTPLFSSIDKYDSGTGWPTFAKPINPRNIIMVEDNTSGEKRIEVRTKRSKSHLGHIFDDGPAEYNYVRFCMNSAALRFVPVADMKKEGYIGYLRIFHMSKK